ncbi:hypothetical protein, partial [Dactylosporangium fulvum]|uniref:hypothetical protein n=1 Tax=Dactylosporangium fulvum TaxID=53359 RepID=UPI0031D53A73
MLASVLSRVFDRSGVLRRPLLASEFSADVGRFRLVGIPGCGRLQLMIEGNFRSPGSLLRNSLGQRWRPNYA